MKAFKKAAVLFVAMFFLFQQIGGICPPVCAQTRPVSSQTLAPRSSFLQQTQVLENRRLRPEGPIWEWVGKHLCSAVKALVAMGFRRYPQMKISRPVFAMLMWNLEEQTADWFSTIANSPIIIASFGPTDVSRAMNRIAYAAAMNPALFPQLCAAFRRAQPAMRTRLARCMQLALEFNPTLSATLSDIHALSFLNIDMGILNAKYHHCHFVIEPTFQQPERLISSNLFSGHSHL